MMRASLVAVVVVPLALACSVEATRYSVPDALRPVREPDGGYLTQRVDASTERACPTGSAAPDAACAVHWATDIYAPLVKGRWSCTASQCHALALPHIDDVDAKVARRELTQAVVAVAGSGKPYIDSCSADPQASSIVCNLVVEGIAATCGVPMPQAHAAIKPDDFDTLKRWLACGAPDN